MAKSLSIGFLAAIIAIVGWTLLRPPSVGAGTTESVVPEERTPGSSLTQDSPAFTGAEAPQERSLPSETLPSSEPEDPSPPSMDAIQKLELKTEGKGKARREIDLVDGQVEGESREYASNGQLIARSFYSDGILNGPWETWRADGVRTCIGGYENGKREGVWVHWKSPGKMHKILTYRGDKLEGSCKTFDELGELLKAESGWFENGVRVRDLEPGDD